jgi:methylated-DNA-protein-cysteine methyltransferase-like protein
MSDSETYQAIYRVVARIPRGCVATYGQIAALAGLPGRARLVGYALRVSDDRSLPWQRVVNARGEISLRDSCIGDAELVQRLRLESEGVRFDEHGRIPLARYQWRP